MKVDKNDPIEPNIIMDRYQDGTVKRVSKGVPIRLLIATEIFAGLVASNTGGEIDNKASYAIAAADKLIEKHNSTSENK